MGHFGAYAQPILVSMMIFPFLAAFITVPYGILNYHRYGGISFWKTLMFYSFVLYMLCAFLLTVLPLPSREAVAARGAVSPCLLPFRNLMEGLREQGFDPAKPLGVFSPRLWKTYVGTNSFFQIFANILMLIPEGIYLRYYFGCSFRKTALLIFLTSLFYELTQLSGLYGIYPHAYRCADVNDLLTNTSGGIIGYCITPALVRFLPTREDMEAISRKKGEYVSVIQEGFAELLDWLIVALVLSIIIPLWNAAGGKAIAPDLGYPASMVWFLLYFGLLQTLLQGSTPGKKLVRVQPVSLDTGKPGRYLFRFLLRSIILAVVYPLVAVIDMMILAATALTFVADCGAALRILAILATIMAFGATFAVIHYTWRKSKQLPHNYFSRLRMMPVA